ncbi:MAG: hypothetical protein IPO17_17205 [Flavobacteriales bacterium]|nr:hypothetical protein [Flavobacteriales bacterium]
MGRFAVALRTGAAFFRVALFFNCTATRGAAFRTGAAFFFCVAFFAGAAFFTAIFFFGAAFFFMAGFAAVAAFFFGAVFADFFTEVFMMGRFVKWCEGCATRFRGRNMSCLHVHRQECGQPPWKSVPIFTVRNGPCSCTLFTFVPSTQPPCSAAPFFSSRSPVPPCSSRKPRR